MQDPSEPDDAAVANEAVVEAYQGEAGKGGGPDEHQLCHESDLVGSLEHGNCCTGKHIDHWSLTEDPEALTDIIDMPVPAIVLVGEYDNDDHTNCADLGAVSIVTRQCLWYRCTYKCRYHHQIVTANPLPDENPRIVSTGYGNDDERHENCIDDQQRIPSSWWIDIVRRRP
jgi:hypothetical protein